MVMSSYVSQTTQHGQSGGQTSTSGYFNNRYFGALVLLAAIIPLPFFAALITIILYLSPSY